MAKMKNSEGYVLVLANLIDKTKAYYTTESAREFTNDVSKARIFNDITDIEITTVRLNNLYASDKHRIVCIAPLQDGKVRLAYTLSYLKENE